jgi:hypothetical protein
MCVRSKLNAIVAREVGEKPPPTAKLLPVSIMVGPAEPDSSNDWPFATFGETTNIMNIRTGMVLTVSPSAH